MMRPRHAGIGLAVAVLLDATIVRVVLLPASMKLLGDWNWYMPRWLEWIPRFGAKTAVAPAAEQVEPRIPRVRPTAVAESAEAAA